MRKFFTAIFIFSIFIGAPVANAEDQNGLNVSLSSIRTEAEQAAVGFLVEWSEKVSVEKLIIGDKWFTQLSPDIKIQTGEKDAFNGIIAKIKGYNAIFQTKEIGGVVAVDSTKPFHILPFAAGVETNRQFSNVNVLAEVGYAPFMKINDNYFLGLNPAMAIYVQGGYKFKVNDNENLPGGASDQSKEDSNSALARAKIGAKAEVVVMSPRADGRYSISLIPEAWGWYDFVNTKSYYQLVGIIRLGLDKTKNFDFKYEKGSGAPNFNEGEQYSANITMVF